MARPTSRTGRAVTMAALLTTPVLLTGGTSLYLPLIAVAFVMVAAIVASFMVVEKAVEPSRKATGWAAACVFIATIGILVAVPLLILTLRGDRIDATVTAERVTHPSKGGPSYKYRLVTPDGRAVHGELSEPYDEYDVGDKADVVYDPGGVASPDDVDFVRLGPVLAGVVVMLWGAGMVLSVVATKERQGPVRVL